MSGLIWVQTVWHSNGIPEIIFQKVDFEKNQQMTKKYTNLPIMPRVSTSDKPRLVSQTNITFYAIKIDSLNCLRFVGIVLFTFYIILVFAWENAL